MARVLSDLMTNIEASPLVANDPRNEGARLRIISALVTSAAGDGNGDIYAICQVHSGWSIKSILVANSAIANGTDWDLGLYTKGTSTAVDADCYADGVTMATIVPAVPPTNTIPGMRDLRWADASTANTTDVNNKVWQDAGATEDPNLVYDLCFTGVAVGDGGTIAVNVLYTDGS